MAEANTENTFDSGRQHLGTVYAKALLAAAEGAGKLDDIVDELTSLVDDVLKKKPQLDAVFASPRIEAEAKVALLDKAFGKRMSATLLNSLKVMARHGRLDCIRAVEQAARAMYNERRGRVEVTIRTAQPLEFHLQQTIAAKLKEKMGKDVDLQVEVRPEILGGLIVKVGDTLFDGSLVTRLEKMRVEAIQDTVKTLRQASHRFATT